MQQSSAARTSEGVNVTTIMTQPPPVRENGGNQRSLGLQIATNVQGSKRGAPPLSSKVVMV